MREIKFRGKRVDNGEWLNDMYSIIQDADGVWLCDANTTELVAPSTVGQFTGLLDKNGKEIYEGDVIKVGHNKDANKCRDVFIAVGDVKWNNKSMCLDVGGDILCTLCACDSFYSIEVVGNIHDNPELIK